MRLCTTIVVGHHAYALQLHCTMRRLPHRLSYHRNLPLTLVSNDLSLGEAARVVLQISRCAKPPTTVFLDNSIFVPHCSRTTSRRCGHMWIRCIILGDNNNHLYPSIVLPNSMHSLHTGSVIVLLLRNGGQKKSCLADGDFLLQYGSGGAASALGTQPARRSQFLGCLRRVDILTSAITSNPLQILPSASSSGAAPCTHGNWDQRVRAADNTSCLTSDKGGVSWKSNIEVVRVHMLASS